MQRPGKKPMHDIVVPVNRARTSCHFSASRFLLQLFLLLSRTAGTQEATQQQETSKTTQQLLESSRRLLRLRHDTQQGVTAVRVAGDEHENARRQKEEHVRQVRLQTCQWQQLPRAQAPGLLVVLLLR